MRILVIQLAKMGDIFQTEHFLSLLKRDYPTAEIFLLHSELFYESAQLTSADHLIPLNLDKITATKYLHPQLDFGKFQDCYSDLIYLDQYDIIYNLNSTELAAQITDSLNAKRKTGFGTNDPLSKEWLTFVMSFIKTRKLSTLNLVDIQKGIISEDITDSKAKTPFSDNFLPLKENSNIILQLGSRNEKRQYPIIYFAEIANQLLNEDYKITLVGSSSELTLSEKFFSLLINGKNKNVTNLVGATDIIHLKETLQKAALLITTDTGTMHLAALTDTPVLAIFHGSAYPFETLAFSEKLLCLMTNFSGFPCYPCPDDLSCEFNFACQRFFNPLAITDLLVNKKRFTGLYRTGRDKIGQYLIPCDPSEKLNYEIAVAFLFRKFALQYFKRNTVELDEYLKHYNSYTDTVDKVKELLRRELLLMKGLLEKGINVWEARDNFLILLPLLYQEKILGKCQLTEELLNFLKEFSQDHDKNKINR